MLSHQTPRTYVMMLKREKNALRLQDKWTCRFVKHRHLKVNHEIGLNWTDVRMDFTKFALKSELMEKANNMMCQFQQVLNKGVKV